MAPISIATLVMTLSFNSTFGAVTTEAVSRVENEAPALAGVVPPAGTTLANMDITVKPHPRGEATIYELRSPQSATLFRDQYASNAKRAGYQVVKRNRLVLGVRKDGTSIRLLVIKADRGSAAVLTIKPPSNEPT